MSKIFQKKAIEDDKHFQQGKRQGEIDRLTTDLSTKDILSGRLLLDEAKRKAMKYTESLAIHGYSSAYQPEREKYTLGYLVGYTRMRVTVETSSLTYQEVKDVPPSLFLDYDKLT